MTDRPSQVCGTCGQPLPPPELVTRRQLAGELGVHIRTLSRRIAAINETLPPDDRIAGTGGCAGGYPPEVADRIRAALNDTQQETD